ncbi:ATPase [Sulfolobales archaeon HS-7]|nr:ATPase [Sulfolobales archaeon HS-7]
MGTHDLWVPMKFLFGMPTDEPYDREEEIKTLTEMIRRKQPTVIVGVRRIGKTSIILKSVKNMESPKIFLSAKEFVEGKSFDLQSFLSAYSSLILSEFLRVIDPKIRIPQTIKIRGRELLDTLRELVGYAKIRLNIPLTEVELFLDSFKKASFREGVAEIIELPQRLAEEFSLNFTIIIDEFQYLRLASQNYPGIFHLLRSKWQLHDRVAYVISGSSVGLLERTFSKKTEPFYQFFYPIYVERFRSDVSISFLEQGFSDEGREVEYDAISLAVKELDGIPAWLNYFGLKSISCKRVTVSCAKKVLASLNEDPLIRNIVLDEYRKFGKNARIILKFLASVGGEGKLRGIDISRSGVNEGIKSLLNDGYIERRERGVYKIVDPVISKLIPTIV